MQHSTLFAPIIALVLWTFVMWVWLYATRIPAIRKFRVRLDPEQTKEAFNAQIPAQARWKADNYNHLLEQPTLFYAVALTLAMLDAGDPPNTALAWSYVALASRTASCRRPRTSSSGAFGCSPLPQWSCSCCRCARRFWSFSASGRRF
jgi:hypothetical protein